MRDLLQFLFIFLVFPLLMVGLAYEIIVFISLDPHWYLHCQSGDRGGFVLLSFVIYILGGYIGGWIVSVFP